MEAINLRHNNFLFSAGVIAYTLTTRVNPTKYFAAIEPQNPSIKLFLNCTKLVNLPTYFEALKF